MILKNCDFYEFMERLGDKKIICFARGFQLNSMIYMYDYLWEDKIKYIVDNDTLLCNAVERVKQYEFSLRCPDVLKEEKSDEIVVVIFSMRFYEILSQLDEIKELDDAEVYIFPLMQTYTLMDKGSFRQSQNIALIPKKIHYCWFGGMPLSESAKQCIKSWKKYCPDYEIVQWDESNYDYKKHPYMKEAYECKAYAYVSDYARLDILYENGGIYMDVDVEVKRNLDPLLYNKAYCGFSSHVPRIATGLGFGAIKNFHMLKEMMDIYKYERFIETKGINDTFCQVYNTKVLRHYGLIENGRYQVIEGMACYPKDYFDAMSSYFYIAPRDEKAFSIHGSENTWSDKYSIGFKQLKNEAKSYFEILQERIEKGGKI